MKYSNKIKGIVVFISFIFSQALFGQEIQVKDIVNNRNISSVNVYNDNQSKGGITNARGKMDISIFADDEKITFRHISYLPVSYTKQQILENKNIVYLVKETAELSKIVISVSKWQQNKKEIPQKIVSIDSKEIVYTTPQTAADLLERSGKIFVQKSQLGGGSPMIRGFSTNRLLLSVDGVRMNNAIFRGGNIQNVISIDPFTIKNTEVILGPGSVIYGSDAIGGVMNFYTKTPKLSWSEETLVSGNANTRYASANREKTGHFDINIGLKKWAFLTSVSYSDFDDLRMGENGRDEYLRPEFVTSINGQDVVVNNSNPLNQRFTGYSQLNLTQRAKLVSDDIWEFDLGLHYATTSDYPRYDRLIQYRNEALRFGDWYYGPQRWFMANFQTQKKGNNTYYDNVKFTNAYQRFEESRNSRNFQDVILNVTEEKVDAISSSLDFEKRFNPKIKTFYGLEYVYNKVHSDGYDKNITTDEITDAASRYPDGATWQSMAAYASLEYKPNPKFTLQSGLRYNHIFIHADFDTTFYPFPFTEANTSTGAFTGSIGFSWLPNKWQITANIGTAFRAPNIDDIGKVFDSEPGSVIVPNPNLAPEHAYSAEFGIQKKIGSRFDINFTAFYTLLDDALIRKDFNLNGATEIMYNGELSNVQAIQNASKVYTYGFEFGFAAKFDKRTQITADLTIPRGEEEQADGTSVPLRHVSPIFGNVHFIYKNERFKFDVFTNFNSSITFENLAPSERSKAYLYAIDENGNPFSPSWLTFNAKSNFEINDNINITAALENITDQRYRTYSSGISAPGRNLILSFNYTF
ncbi:hemoglobin/transferrin/lactoferrin receptor protein [Kordia periserrulae]|uniref:Hemoglobin/transferrin/lactoferrin receptor protein n=1 Tax=Kordia periserrulae TaxID=701523 RepID=A0A2T6BVW5_9FLAO|nr:TonB-dependent receptor [Kordia periserrulae]PTX60212.1 hemoglobin/transferrin/lactoferrin receptor protein [Kordia periserrulae]